MTTEFFTKPRSVRRIPRALSRWRAHKNRSKSRGVALVMVTGAIVVLTVMLSEFQEDTGAEVASATSARDAVQAEYFAKSAVNLARLLIATEPTVRSAVAPLFMFMKRTPPQIPVWEFTDRLLSAFNGDEEAKDFQKLIGTSEEGKNLKLQGGHFELSIVDEDSKVNMNQGSSNDIGRIRLGKEIMGLISRPEYSVLFEQKDDKGEFQTRQQICQALIDWADVDETAFVCDFAATAQSSGTEDSYYQTLPKPYRRKNAPYDSLEELRLVRGMGEDFWATFVDPEPNNPKKRVVTVWGQGAVNVNTANAQTLLAIVCAGAPTAEICTDPTQTGLFLTGVTLAKGISMGAPLFGAPNDFVAAMTGKGMLGPILAGAGVKPVKFQSAAEFAKSISTESKVFSIYAVGVKKGYKRETRVKVHTVVDFRTAPPLGSLLTGTTAAGSGTPTPTGSPGTTSSTSSAASNTNPLNRPATGGQVIYYRLE